jgi:hypothetical protein
MAHFVFKTHADPQDYPPDLHVVTFAEQGFAPLDIHGRRLGVSSETLSAFSDTVNQAGHAGSLYPEAPISAVPRSCIRDTTDAAPLIRQLQAFISANAQHIRATSLIFDFSTPRLQSHVRAAIAAISDEPDFSLINNVIVIRN